MNKYVIKIIKRDRSGVKKIAVTLDTPGFERKDRREAAAIVNDWISESRENSRIERLFSKTNISAWKLLPATLPETPI